MRAAAKGAVPLAEAAGLAQRFGVLAAAIVPFLILVGGVVAWILLGSISALFLSSYGAALLVKIGLVGGLLGLAALNKLWLTPAMRRGEPAAAKALSRSISLEILLIIAVLSVTSFFTTTLSPAA